MSKATPWVVILVIAGGLAAWYFYAQAPAVDHPSMVPAPVQDPQPLPPPAEFPVENIPVVIDEPAPEPLPPLADSDQLMIEALGEIIGPESLGSHFVLEQVISRIVATVDSLDSRQLAPLVMPVKPPGGQFRVSGTEVSGTGNLTIHPDNAARYQPWVSIASAMDAQEVVDLYVKFYPLFQQAYAELGHGEAYFNDRLVEVIDHLLATPLPGGELQLTRPEAVYLFEDPDLEALTGGQKLLLRIGEDNAGIVLDKLLKIRRLLVQ